MNSRTLLAVVAMFFLVGILSVACGGGESKDKDSGSTPEDIVSAEMLSEVSTPEDLAADQTVPLDVVEADVATDLDDDVPIPPEEIIEELVEEIVVLDPEAIKSIQGTVQDGAGAPLAGLFVQPCTYTEEMEQCHKANSDADGFFEKLFDPAKTDIIAIHVRFVTDLFTPTACYYVADEMPFADNVVDFANPFVLFEMGDTVAVVETDVSADTEVAIPGVEFSVPVDAWFPGIFEKVEIRGVRYPLEQHTPCFLSEETMPDELYVFTPDWVSFSTPGGLEITFDNTKNLAPGTQVSLWVLGQLDTQIIPLEGETIHVHTGDWVEFGKATVSEGGAAIVSDPGSGVPGLGWIGWKVVAE
jgi:hypothetical protein